MRAIGKTGSHLAALRRLSARIGADLSLVQGAGGNTSEKINGVLWVKASGTWLSDAERLSIFVPLALADLRRAITLDQEAVAQEMLGEGSRPDGMRPSIEASLHALMPHRVVVHIHSANALALAVRSDAGGVLSGRLDGLRWLAMPYVRPGWPLTRAVAQRFASSGEAPDVLVLGNHGLVIGADSCEKAAVLVDLLERRLAAPVRAFPPSRRKELESVASGLPFRVPAAEAAHWPALSDEALQIAAAGSLYPDQVVFLGPSATVASDRAELAVRIADYRARHSKAPPFVLLKSLGTLMRDDLPGGAEPVLACLGLVLARVEAGAPLRYLTEIEEAELLGWEAEQYRRRLGRP